MRTYKGVWLADMYAPRKKSLEAIVHTALAVIKARTMNPDILHLHAVGPALMVPLARLLREDIGILSAASVVYLAPVLLIFLGCLLELRQSAGE